MVLLLRASQKRDASESGSSWGRTAKAWADLYLDAMDWHGPHRLLPAALPGGEKISALIGLNSP